MRYFAAIMIIISSMGITNDVTADVFKSQTQKLNLSRIKAAWHCDAKDILDDNEDCLEKFYKSVGSGLVAKLRDASKTVALLLNINFDAKKFEYDQELMKIARDAARDMEDGDDYIKVKANVDAVMARGDLQSFSYACQLYLRAYTNKQLKFDARVAALLEAIRDFYSGLEKIRCGRLCVTDYQATDCTLPCEIARFYEHMQTIQLKAQSVYKSLLSSTRNANNMVVPAVTNNLRK